MGRLKAVFFDLGDTIIAEIDGPADVDSTDFDILDGAEEALSELRKRYKLVIVSNTFSWGDRDVVRALKRKDLAKYFDAIVTSVDAGSRKPEPGIYRKALSMAGCAPREAVMVGDRVDTDIAGANKVGITSVLCRWNERYPVTMTAEENLPDFVIASIKELPALIIELDESD
jgi:putative hydrolase of the HAD superfamily